MRVKVVTLSAVLALAWASASLAGDLDDFNPHHYRFYPNGRGGFNIYDAQGYRGWMGQNGYFDNQGTGFRHWQAPDGEIPEIPEY